MNPTLPSARALRDASGLRTGVVLPSLVVLGDNNDAEALCQLAV